MEIGWVKLHRKLKGWEWKTKPLTLALFVHLLLEANHRDGNWRGVPIAQGSMLTGRKKLAKETGLSEQQIRTALSHLKSTNEITIKATKEYSIITITNWISYQDVNQQNPNEQPSDNQAITTNKNNNNDKNNKEYKKALGVDCFLTDWMESNHPDEPRDLPQEWGNEAERIAQQIKPFSGLDTEETILMVWNSFYDYWTGSRKTTMKKSDWIATWRNKWRKEFINLVEKEERNGLFKEKFGLRARN